MADLFVEDGASAGATGIGDGVSGKVGIGTNSPDMQLSVTTGSSGSQAIFGQDVASGHASIVIGPENANDSSGSICYDISGKYLALQIAGDAAGSSLVISNGGNVGIGTASPGAKLEVGGDLIISDGSGNESIIVVDAPSTGGGAAAANRTKIQDAIDAVAGTGGGTVYLQSGTYVVEENSSNGYAILLEDGVVESHACYT